MPATLTRRVEIVKYGTSGDPIGKLDICVNQRLLVEPVGWCAMARTPMVKPTDVLSSVSKTEAPTEITGRPRAPWQPMRPTTVQAVLEGRASPPLDERLKVNSSTCPQDGNRVPASPSAQPPEPATAASTPADCHGSRITPAWLYFSAAAAIHSST